MSLYLVMGPFSLDGGSHVALSEVGDTADTCRFCGSPGTFTANSATLTPQLRSRVLKTRNKHVPLLTKYCVEIRRIRMSRTQVPLSQGN